MLHMETLFKLLFLYIYSFFMKGLEIYEVQYINNAMFIIFLLYLLGDVGRIVELLSFIGVAKCLCF